jgi:hypothetical protein
MSTQQHRATVDGEHVPADLKQWDIWVLWVPEWDKVARAPWQADHMYPCEWSQAKPVDPRRDYDTASAAASVPIETIHRRWSFPDDKPLPDAVKPAVLLPPAHHDCPVAFVDFDDVRDPETGAITAEVADLLDRLDSYTEVSRSDEGLHTYVRGSLPEGVGKFIEPLGGPGHIEVYDHGRMTGGTWRHVAGTPPDHVRDAQATLDEIFDEYGSDAEPVPDREPRARDHNAVLSGNTTTDRSPYYDALQLRSVADQGPFRHHRTDPRNPGSGDWQGPHPGHGGTSTSDRDSTNFNVDGDQWHCFAHDDGGGALELVAVVEGVVDCGRSGAIHREAQALLQTCLHAREHYGVPDDADPPYAALWAVAQFADLAVDDTDAQILGPDAYNIARQVYDELTPGEVSG